jgi:hypothetical protein
MIDGTAMSNDLMAPEMPRHEEVASLEQRVRRLEDAVATMQDTRQLEERVVERLTRQAPVATPAAVAAPNSSGLLLEASRRLLPAAVDVIQAEARSADAQARHANPQATRPAWLLVDTYAEVRAMFYMYVDPRYRMTWTGRVVPLVLLAAVLTSMFWFPFLGAAYQVSPFVGILLMKPIDLVLAFFLFRILGREARRYRETAPDLPPAIRG